MLGGLPNTQRGTVGPQRAHGGACSAALLEVTHRGSPQPRTETRSRSRSRGRRDGETESEGQAEPSGADWTVQLTVMPVYGSGVLLPLGLLLGATRPPPVGAPAAVRA